MKKKCINCSKEVTITFPYKIIIHKGSQKTVCHDGYGYADSGDTKFGKVFGA